jgi:integrase
MAMNSYPKGTLFNNFTLHFEVQKGITRAIIRRWVIFADGTRKHERYPAHLYSHLRSDHKELEKFVIRLNNQIPEKLKTQAKVEIKHAFIDDALLESYKDYLVTQIPTTSRALSEHYYLVKYFLHFFIGQMDMPNPLDWHRVHETEWAKFLVSPDAPAAATTKREIVAAANRFMRWLHKRRPSEVPPLEFKPLSTPTLKQVEAKRELAGTVHHPKMLKDKDWETIKKNIPEGLRPLVMLAYSYGLRRSESLALKSGDVKKGYLSVERSLVGPGEYTTLKAREKRQTPHWTCTAAQAYGWIEEIHAKGLVIHPDSFTKRWNAFQESLKMTYTLHDLRHTFITKALRTQVARDVQLAVGHADISTTMGYAHDDRELEDEVFIPSTG